MDDESIEVIYEDDEIKRYQMDILSSGRADLFLPVSFIDSDGVVGAVYDKRGYSKLAGRTSKDISYMLQAAAVFLEKSRKCEKRYIFGGEYSLEDDDIYLAKKYPDIKLVFRGGRSIEKGEVLLKLKRILKSAKINNAREEEFLDKGLRILSDPEESYSLMICELKKLAKESFKV